MALTIKNNIALITGASSGIGKATAIELAKIGVNLIVTARRMEKLQALAAQLEQEYRIKVLPLQMDIRDRQAVEQAIQSLPKAWQPVDILVNNAGTAIDSTMFQEGNMDSWDAMIQTNVNGLLYVSRLIVDGMVKRSSGHIINIGSIAGHDYYLTGNIYSATKHAVKAISRSMHIDLLGTGVRVSEVSPGAVHTEFSEVRWKDKSRSDDFYQKFTPLQAEDIADAVVYCATRPLHVDISEIIVVPTIQATCNHIHMNGSDKKSMFD